MKLHQTAGCVLFNQNKNRVFLIYKDCRNEWLLPKGHVEEGESWSQAALRELTEETGFCDYRLISSKPIDESIFEFKDEHGRTAKKKLVVFAVVLKSEKMISDKSRSEGVARGKWWRIDEAIKVASYDNIKNAIIKGYEQVKSVKTR